MSLSRNTLQGCAFVLFGLMLFLSVLFNLYKLESLSFHTKDFPYYLQFGPKLLDPRLSPHMSINPEGFNFLGLRGTEATTSLHQAIHFEPIKYVEGVLLATFKHPISIFVLVALIFFAPILYLATLFPISERKDGWFILLFCLVYCLYPSVLFDVSNDIRPFQLLAPLFVLAFLAVNLQRPPLEKLLCFNAMFLAREEALIFGSIIILYTFSLNFRYLRAQLGDAKPLLISWLTWAAIIALYFRWTGYTNLASPAEAEATSRLFNPWAALPLVLLALAFALTLFALWKQKLSRERYIPVASFALVLVPLAWQYYTSYRSVTAVELIENTLYGSRMMLYVSCLLLGLLLVWQRLHQARHKLVLLLLLCAAIGGSALCHALAPDSALAVFRAYQKDRQESSIIWQFRGRTDRYQSAILTDKWSYQAFYDYEHVYLYERLPWHLVPGAARYYPANRATLQRLIEEQVEFVVISKGSVETLLRLIEQSGARGQLAYVADNDRYFIYQLLRPDSAPSTAKGALFGGAIRLTSHHLERPHLAPGETVRLTLNLQNLAPLPADYNILLRLVGPDGSEVWREEGWPFGSPTSTWPYGALWPDGHTIAPPPTTPPGDYALEVSFYDPATLAPLPVSDGRTGESLGHSFVVDTLRVAP